MRLIVGRLLPLFLLASCDDSPSGLDLTSLDEEVDPCDDFYQFACGGWIADNPVRPGAAEQSRFSEPFYAAVPRLRAIVEDALPTSTIHEERLVGQYYQACLRAPTSTEARSQLKTLVEEADGITSLEALATQVAAQRALGSRAFFSFGVQVDPGDTARHVAYLGQGGIELPDPSYYLDPDQEPLREQYRAHVAALSSLVLGSSLDADAVLRVETALASAFVPEEDYDPSTSYHPLSPVETATLAPSFPWVTFWNAAGFEGVDRIDVQHLEYLDALERLFTTTSIADLVSYMKWQLIQDRADALDAQVTEQNFAFWNLFLGGTEPPSNDWLCFLETMGRFDAPIAQEYFRQHLDARRFAGAQALSLEVMDAFSARMDAAAWLDPATREEAHAKLERMQINIGRPQLWPSYVDLDLDDLSFFDMNTRLVMRSQARARERLDQPVDRTAWVGPTLSNNAFYHPLFNSVTVDALILGSPFFTPDAPKALNLGALGTVISHELSHGFDDGGRRYDRDGILRDWWTPETAASFEERAQCLVDQFDGFEALPGEYVNGRLTLGENIADLGGLAIAHRALVDSGDDQGGDGFDADQIFFLAHAQVWCRSVRPEWIATLLASDPHSPAKFRVNGPLSNLPAFAEAFECDAGAPMVRSTPCEVW